jgi:hypothetical protein
LGFGAKAFGKGAYFVGEGVCLLIQSCGCMIDCCRPGWREPNGMWVSAISGVLGEVVDL